MAASANTSGLAAESCEKMSVPVSGATSGRIPAFVGMTYPAKQGQEKGGQEWSRHS